MDKCAHCCGIPIDFSEEERLAGRVMCDLCWLKMILKDYQRMLEENRQCKMSSRNQHKALKLAISKIEAQLV